MTLVIAQKTGTQVSLSSDSRITFGSVGFIDYGIKIFTVPVKIHGPTEKGQTELLYNHDLGLAIVGNTMNAYTVKESVYEILQNLQYVPLYANISMDLISSLVFKVFNKTTFDFGQIMHQYGVCELVLTGYCPVQNMIRTFKFSCDISNYPIKPHYDEILKTDGLEFLGSGEKEAKSAYTINPSLSPLHIVRQVVRGGKIATVGGGLQYGEIQNNNFIIFGIVDYNLNDDETFKEYLYTLRGINLYKDEFESWDEGFHIAYTFKMPFEKEINESFDV